MRGMGGLSGLSSITKSAESLSDFGGFPVKSAPVLTISARSLHTLTPSPSFAVAIRRAYRHAYGCRTRPAQSSARFSAYPNQLKTVVNPI